MLVPGRVHIFTQPKNDGVGLARILEIEMFVLDMKWFLVEWNGTSNENYLIPIVGSVIRETSSMNEWMHGIRATCSPFPHLLYRCSECKGSNWHQQGHKAPWRLRNRWFEIIHRLFWDAPPSAPLVGVVPGLVRYPFKHGHIILVVDEPAFVGARQRLRSEERLPEKGDVRGERKNYGHGENHGKPRWWFQICFMFIPIWENDPIWLTDIFWDGLKPPTRNVR